MTDQKDYKEKKSEYKVITCDIPYLYHTTPYIDHDTNIEELTDMDNKPWYRTMKVGEFSQDLDHPKWFTINQYANYGGIPFKNVFLKYTTKGQLRLVDLRKCPFDMMYPDMMKAVDETKADGYIGLVDDLEVYLRNPKNHVHPYFEQLTEFPLPPKDPVVVLSNLVKGLSYTDKILIKREVLKALDLSTTKEVRKVLDVSTILNKPTKFIAYDELSI
ncbi:MAG: hypothetical protein Solumvirus5_19 [Solumvirus sp.]|uniref:Uncharacterized protein n=1 Tax=Solumvirus sp. TaxID=2487773 RepID=A0A3G5AGP3_9VIRU|nr:MAG: hypothetical protein Solumvirus5_19 [Solumvirus sp.]